ncbi:hypothetical protein Tco_0455293 [Tanacetum coccineum]
MLSSSVMKMNQKLMWGTSLIPIQFNTTKYRIPKDSPIKNVMGCEVLYLDKKNDKNYFMNKVWKLVDLPNGKKAIGTKWVLRNNKDERGIVIRNKQVGCKESKTSWHVKRGRDTKIPQSSGPPVKVSDEAVHKELGDRMERAATTASSLEAEQDSATARTIDEGKVEITASIDGQVKTITEASLRRHLKLEDSDGITSLPNTEIFEQLALMGYVSDSARLTFQKGHFSPQWRFFIHTILHCLSPKTTAWEQFSSNIATAIICLATNRTFNFSKMIFDAMVKNLDSTHKFLMYPRFLQIYLNKQKRLLQPHTRTYPTPTLTQKLFSNMKRVSKGYSGVDFPLFPTMITTPESSPSRITSSPSLSPQTHQSHQSSPLRDITRQAAEIPQS